MDIPFAQISLSLIDECARYYSANRSFATEQTPLKLRWRLDHVTMGASCDNGGKFGRDTRLNKVRYRTCV